MGDTFQTSAWESFAPSLFYHPGDIEQPGDFVSLRRRCDELEGGGEASRVYYLSTAPRFYQSAIAHLGSAELNQIGAIIDVAPEHFKVWSGNDSDTLTVMALGGYGVVSVASHLIGFQIRAMIDAILDGRMPDAARMHHRMQTLVDVLFIESNPIPVKHAVNRAGLRVGPTRLPLVPASPDAAALIESELERHVIDLKGALTGVA